MVLIEGHFDVDLQFALDKGLQRVVVRRGDLGALKHGGVGIRRELDHRHVQFLPENLGRLYAVHRALEADVHEREVRAVLAGQCQRFLARGGNATDRVAVALQPRLQVGSDHDSVFHDQQSDWSLHRLRILKPAS